MRFRVEDWKGIAPAVTPRSLPDGAAQVAVNCKLWKTHLETWKVPRHVANLALAGTKKGLYRFGQDEATDTQHWFSWLNDVDVVAIPGGANERTFYSGDGVMKWTDSTIGLSGSLLPSVSYPVGVPRPAVAPSAVVTGSAGSGEVPTSRNYVMTFVAANGEEGAASDVSNQVTASLSQTITLNSLEVPSGAGSYPLKRVYELVTGNSSTAWVRKAEIASALTTTNFPGGTGAISGPSESGTAYTLQTATLFPPPADITSLKIMPGPFLAGISNKRIVFSALGYLYGWPPLNEYLPRFQPVGLGVFGNSLVVATKGFPEIWSGVDPTQMQPTVIEKSLGCVAKRSVIEMDGGVGYAAASGFVVVNSSGADVITSGYFDSDDWKAFNPSSMHGAWWNKQLVLFYDSPTKGKGGLIIRPGNLPTTIDIWASAAYVDKIRDALYLIIDNEIVQFDAGSTHMLGKYRSKVLQDVSPSSIAAIQLEAREYPIHLKIYGDGGLADNVTIYDNLPESAMSDELYQAWEVEFSWRGLIYWATIADSMDALQQI
jgi:hypothetical protein